MKTNYSFKKTVVCVLFSLFAWSFQAKAQQETINGIIYQVVAPEGGDKYAETVASRDAEDKLVPYTSEMITIPAKVTIGGTEYPVKKIGNNSMRENPNLKTVSLPAGLETIGNSSFAQCPLLSGIVLPASVKSIEDWAFYGCPSLEQINIPDGITAITEHTFPQTGLKSIELPPSVKTIGTCAFQTATQLSSINLDNITEIKSWALGETALPSVVVKNVKFLGNQSFYACPELESVVMESAVQTGEWSFQNCTKLKQMTLPNTLESIDGGAFSGCSSLKSMVIPKSVQFLGGWAFEKTAITEIFASWENPNDVITDANIFGADEGKINFTWKIPERLKDVYGDVFLDYPVEIGEPGNGNEFVKIDAKVVYSAGNLSVTNLNGYKAFIYSQDGRVVACFGISENHYNKSLSLTPGIYFFNAVNSGKIATIKFYAK